MEVKRARQAVPVSAPEGKIFLPSRELVVKGVWLK